MASRGGIRSGLLCRGRMSGRECEDAMLVVEFPKGRLEEAGLSPALLRLL